MLSELDKKSQMGNGSSAKGNIKQAVHDGMSENIFSCAPIAKAHFFVEPVF